MSNKNKKKNNAGFEARDEYDSPARRRREKIKKAGVWVIVSSVILTLIITMAPDPSAFIDPNLYTEQPQ